MVSQPPDGYYELLERHTSKAVSNNARLSVFIDNIIIDSGYIDIHNLDITILLFP